jgi:hypothetical protein
MVVTVKVHTNTGQSTVMSMLDLTAVQYYKIALDHEALLGS